MSSEQTALDVRASEASATAYLPLRLRRQEGASEATSLLSSFGLDPSYIGQDARTLSDSDKARLRRYQFDRVYFYPRRSGPSQTEYEPVEFRTYIVTVGEPTERLKEFIRDTMNGRLRTLFNTGPYLDYMSGFNFVDFTTNIEDDAIAADEAGNIGIPQFEVLVTKNGVPQGQSTGFAYPFTLDEEPVAADEVPQQEVWGLARQQDRYRVEPPGGTASRQRASAIRGKDVYVNGALIGTVAKGGRAFIRKEYQNPDQVYRGQHSRQWLIDNTAATASALRDGGNLYKVSETNGAVYLVTAANKPDGFSPTDADAVTTDAVVASDTTVQSVEIADKTRFDIRSDTGPMLGKYDTPTQRDIDESTDYLIY